MKSITKKLGLLFVLLSLLCCFSVSTAMADTTLPSRCTIASALGGNLVLDVEYNSSENCANVQIYSHHGGGAQIFDIVHVENEWYRIVHASSGKFLDVAGAVVDSGVNVQIYENTGSNAQLWKFIPTDGGYYIQNKLGYYLDVCNGTAQNGTNVWVWGKNGTTAQIWSLNTVSSQLQPAMWFMDVVKLTQEPGGGYSHRGTLNFDVVGVNNSDIRAPFDCKVVAIHKSWAEGNTVVIESLTPVQYADGTVDYMCMSFAHDNDISNLWVGKTIAQGETFYQTGKYGYVTGVHSHVSCIRGTYQKDIWKRQPPNNNCGSPNAICPTKALFLPEGIAIYETKGLTFKTYTPLPPVATPIPTSTPTPVPVWTPYEAAKPIPALTGNQAEDVAQIALSQVGYRENKGNGTVYGAWWTQVTNWGTDYTYSDWCCMFACWCADQAGAGVNVAFNKSSARVINLFNFINKNGFCDTTFQTEPKAGDFIFFRNGNATVTLPHVGIIVAYDSATKEITYVGGNQYLDATCNSAVTVRYCKWEAGAVPKGEVGLYIYGYGRPAYTNSQTTSNTTSVPSTSTLIKASSITVQATGAGNITNTNATVYGNVKYSGSRPSEVGLLFGESTESLQAVAKDSINFSKNPFDVWYDLNKEANVTLVPGRTYYYQLYTVANGKYTYSNVQSFTTTSPVSAWTRGATNITSTNATVNGSVQYTGNRPTAVGLYFGTNPAALSHVAYETINFSKNPFDVWYDLTKELGITLSANQTYYYQFYVIQDGYYYYSNMDSFQN